MRSDSFDLVIIGGGIAGLSTACLHKRRFPDSRVLLVERARIGAGLTGRAGGHRMPGFEADHSAIAHLIGEKRALRLYAETRAASDLTDTLIREEGIACDAAHGYWVLDEDESGFERLCEFMAPRRALGLPEPQLFRGAALKRRIGLHGFDAGLYFPDIASFEPSKFLAGLARAFLRHGGEIAQGREYVAHERCGAGLRVIFADGSCVETKRLVLAGGDALARRIPWLRRRTMTVYTARIGLQLNEDAFRRLSPTGAPLAGCDSNLRAGDNPLQGDFLWFSLRADRSLAMGFGACLAGLTPKATQREVAQMTQQVRRACLARLGLRDDRALSIRESVGGLNTASNLLPIVGSVDGDDNVQALAAQSGMGLNQSILMAKAMVDHFAGDSEIYDMLRAFQRTQAIIPPTALLRKAAAEMGALEKSASLAPVRAACGAAHRIAQLYSRASYAIARR